MKTLLSTISAALLLASALGAAPIAKTYQVTGPILELTDKTIVVQKDGDRWEIARDENTKTKTNLKVGQKVTIHYRMTATSVEIK